MYSLRRTNLLFSSPLLTDYLMDNSLVLLITFRAANPSPIAGPIAKGYQLPGAGITCLMTPNRFFELLRTCFRTPLTSWIDANSAVEDLLDLHNSFGVVCFMGVPLIAKDRFVGALMVGSTTAGALSPSW